MRTGDNYFDLMEFFRRLSTTTRFNQDPRLLPQSVAEHSFHVAVLAHFVAFELRELGHKIDVEKTTALALLHDFGEAFTGDIASPVKYLNQATKSVLEVAENTMMRASLPDDLPRYFTDGIYSAARCDGSVEWLVVKSCDMLEAVIHLLYELECGNRHMEHHLGHGLSIFLWRRDHPVICESPMLKYLGEESLRLAMGMLSEDGQRFLEQRLGGEPNEAHDGKR